jgi:hypothetical protein
MMFHERRPGTWPVRDAGPDQIPDGATGSGIGCHNRSTWFLSETLI